MNDHPIRSVKHRPLLMKGPLVRATLEGRKTVTRRTNLRWLKAKPGDLIYVCETWAVDRSLDDVKPSDLGMVDVEYQADRTRSIGRASFDRGKTRVSIFMQPRFARLWLEVVSVRTERLWDITEDDAKAEGAKFHDGHGVGHSGWRLDERDVYGTARDAFLGIWRDINGVDSVMANPIIARIEFKRAERPDLSENRTNEGKGG